MSKKKRKDKKTRKPQSRASSLRGKQKNIKTEPQKTAAPAAVVDVRQDLRKTAILTAVCLAILLALLLTQSRWLTRLPGF